MERRADLNASHAEAPRARRPADNFAFLRLLAAFMVLASHQAAVMGRGEWTLFDDRSSGGYGVLIFFVISGYLVCQSWQDDPNPFRFVLRRLLRVWPGLAWAVVVTVFVIGPALTTLPMRAYWSNDLTWHYFVLWKFELAGKLPGVFETNPIPFVNASLWTIPIELRWYWILTILGIARFVRFRSLLLVGTAALAVHYFLVFDLEAVLARGGARAWKEEFGLFFLAGACLQRFQDVWVPRRFLILPAVALVALGSLLAGQAQVGVWLILPIVVVALGRASWPFVRRFDRFGDLSYGTYMYAFPAQQVFVALSANGLSYGTGFALSAILTLSLAALSWHFVEAPCLALKPRREGLAAYGRRLRLRFAREAAV